MAEYICREALIEMINGNERPENERIDIGYNEALNDIKQLLVNDIKQRLVEMPAEDVQPAKHGKWEQIGEQNAKCTDCGGVLRSNGIDKTGKALIFNAVYHYCPFCGARMDKS